VPSGGVLALLRNGERCGTGGERENAEAHIGGVGEGKGSGGMEWAAESPDSPAKAFEG
jgi:hypothetical protein